MNTRILPAYPLFVKEPNFSVWCYDEQLNSRNVQTWWGEYKKIYGLVKTHGKTFCFLGDASQLAHCGVLPAVQTHLEISAFATNYVFQMDDVTLKVSFVSPLLPDDLQLLSMPVCYLRYEIDDDDAEVSLFANRNVCYNDIDNDTDKVVRGDVAHLDGFESAFFGLRRQLYLSNNDDRIGADWGYWHVAGQRAYLLDGTDLANYIKYGYLDCFCACDDKYVGAVNKGSCGVLMMGYDDVVAIDYFGDFLRGYYLQDHTIFDGLDYVWKNYRQIDEELFVFDEELQQKAQPFGKEYLNVLYASLRQSIGAHKLVQDKKGNFLFLSKEHASNGCIGTVDISYPSMPLFLLYNTELVKAMMRPILAFANMPVWQYDFAPHDVGTYPACCGQVYGLNEQAHRDLFYGCFLKTIYHVCNLPSNFDAYNLDMQMPVEESANMLIMTYACQYFDGDKSFFQQNKELFDKWVKYLVEYGLKPGNQLCTDDFAGHLENNVNLAIKATVGIGCYAEMLRSLGEKKDYQHYRAIAESYAKQICDFAYKYPHMPLTWDNDQSTFSLKYNFAFDKILRLGLFPQELLEREVDYYLTIQNRFGAPLDSRKEYTKSDWILWTASLTDDTPKQHAIVDKIDNFLKNSPDRVPFSDWYESEVGFHHHFRGRSVQGANFILLLKNKGTKL